MADTTQTLRAAAAKAREEATELAKLPTPNLADEHPDVDAATEHLLAMREMRIRYVLADTLDAEADWHEHNWFNEDVLTDHTQRALTLARAVLREAR